MQTVFVRPYKSIKAKVVRISCEAKQESHHKIVLSQWLLVLPKVLGMEFVEIEAGLAHIRGSEIEAELFDDGDRQALETNVLDHIQLGGFGLQDLKWGDDFLVSAAQSGSVLQQLGQDANTVVFLQTTAMKIFEWEQFRLLKQQKMHFILERCIHVTLCARPKNLI